MNDLNSVLIEGTVITEPYLSVIEGSSKCHFRMESLRYDKIDGAICEERNDFDIVTRGHQAEIYYEYLKKGRGVRVVGRLSTQLAIAPKYPVYIVAEHVEFKPEKPKKAGE